MRQVRVQGCLPTLAVLVILAALAALAVTAGLAVVLFTAGLLAVLAVIGFVRRLFGAAPMAHGPGGGRAGQGGPGGVEAVPPGWMEREGGPVVEAGPRDPARGRADPARDGADPIGDGERTLPPRG